MKGINFGRVILGGLVAGVLINVSEFVLNNVVLKADMEAGMKALAGPSRWTEKRSPSG